ncbi:hypothetical protein FHS35_005060 [Streptomyces umbrinus]|uniref:SCO2400 family protein n=1 Tax=Streptomyces umbrinus TaxID=67370 RepID=UPI00167F167F|nr:hypothetical protein [Streptomyces umbrinus]MCR3728185.1 hypothetical protein [Streptomyces umbrinus]GHH35980.1 hypothetical protein GCM10018775_11390 [Streptomyces umbrinus]
MDYCTSCRRHLNGALVCPGCGAYAPDIAPVTTAGHTVPAPAVSATTGMPPAWEPPLTDPGDDDLVPVPSAPQGRAARRRQRARWKKNQRRAVVATAVALVGGGLTVSAMDQRSGDRAQAATAPESTGTDTDIADEPSTPYTPSTGTRPDTGASSPTSAAPERPSRQRTAAPPRSTPSNLRTDSAAPPRTTTESTPQPQTTSPTSPAPEDTVSDRNEVQPSQTPTPSATEPSSQPPQTSPAPTATSPSQICLLVVCLG